MTLKKLNRTHDGRYPARVGANYVIFVFNGVTESGKTAEYSVLSDMKDAVIDADMLGTISWFGRWRTYAFDPWPGTTFEKTCLRDIADFCERLTKEHNARLRANRKRQ